MTNPQPMPKLNPLSWLLCRTELRQERVAKFNVEKIKPQDLAGAAGPPDEEG